MAPWAKSGYPSLYTNNAAGQRAAEPEVALRILNQGRGFGYKHYVSAWLECGSVQHRVCVNEGMLQTRFSWQASRSAKRPPWLNLKLARDVAACLLDRQGQYLLVGDPRARFGTEAFCNSINNSNPMEMCNAPRASSTSLSKIACFVAMQYSRFNRVAAAQALCYA
eukprot:78833-Pelagomonas_calceolata.AAC.5